MCCFSGPVDHVGQTRIFARLSGRGTQFLAYHMTYRAARPVAMILPLPVALPARENAVRFIDLKGYREFFTDMESGFLPPVRFNIACSATASSAAGSALAVQDVGDFIASFVPTLNDFRRLDPRFVLPRQVWDALPEYRDYGFAVFQLKAAPNSDRTPHPMAFEFPTRLARAVFFPTVHIHDGQVHQNEHFDHSLYIQGAGAHGDASKGLAETFLDLRRAQGLVVAGERCRRVEKYGYKPNRDVLLSTFGDPAKILVPGALAAAVGAYVFARHRRSATRRTQPDGEIS